ncbi:L-histidine N(alpha)-methyltransferase [Methylophilaceae bacterium]|nr:L-histidine N(alpha)-methyltransferase [Methylophilaceae bacterium]
MDDENIKDLDYFVDIQPKTQIGFYEAVLEGLSLPQKTISPKFFYNELGSKIFDKICDTPEYYLTRTEIALLNNIQEELYTLVEPGSAVVEYGCGSSIKIKALLSALPEPSHYIAIDISKTHLISTAKEIASNYNNISVAAICADFMDPINWPERASFESLKRLAFFPGSTIGNLNPSEASQFLKNVRHLVGDEGTLLIGVDMKKDAEIFNRAYNDKEGHTADFNLNLLHRMEKELDADINISEFSHKAFYNEKLGRVEMHLISDTKQEIKINNLEFPFQKGESIHTECSYKYSIIEFSELAKKSGFSVLKNWSDKRNFFSTYLLKAI